MMHTNIHNNKQRVNDTKKTYKYTGPHNDRQRLEKIKKKDSHSYLKTASKNLPIFSKPHNNAQSLTMAHTTIYHDTQKVILMKTCSQTLTIIHKD